MSRRRVSAIQPGWYWEYGWDPSLQTFFAQLLPADRDLDSPVEWYGGIRGAVPTVEDLISRMGVELSAEQIAQLEADRASQSEEVDLCLPAPLGGPPLQVPGGDRPPRQAEPARRVTRQARSGGQERAGRPGDDRPGAVLCGRRVPAHNPDGGRLRAWRQLTPPELVEAFIDGEWHDAAATSVNDVTGEITVLWPPLRPERELSVPAEFYKPVDPAHFPSIKRNR